MPLVMALQFYIEATYTPEFKVFYNFTLPNSSCLRTITDNVIQSKLSKHYSAAQLCVWGGGLDATIDMMSPQVVIWHGWHR